MIRRVLALASVAVLLGATPTSAQGCVVSGIQTSDFGGGSGFLAPASLGFGFDPGSCTLEWKLDAPTCCNVLVQQHFLAIGNLADPFGLPLGPPFYSGSVWHIGVPQFALGPFTGVTGSVPLPSDPSLIGLALPTQAILDYLTTIGLTHDFGMSQGVLVTFQ